MTKLQFHFCLNFALENHTRITAETARTQKMPMISKPVFFDDKRIFLKCILRAVLPVVSLLAANAAPPLPGSFARRFPLRPAAAATPPAAAATLTRPLIAASWRARNHVLELRRQILSSLHLFWFQRRWVCDNVWIQVRLCVWTWLSLRNSTSTYLLLPLPLPRNSYHHRHLLRPLRPPTWRSGTARCGPCCIHRTPALCSALPSAPSVFKGTTELVVLYLNTNNYKTQRISLLPEQCLPELTSLELRDCFKHKKETKIPNPNSFNLPPIRLLWASKKIY